jgi:rhamnogalacturonan endolyase
MRILRANAMLKCGCSLLFILAVLSGAVSQERAPHQMEKLGRGVVAVRQSESQVYVGWRLLGTDSANIAFNVYRAAEGNAPTKLNDMPLTTTTDFIDRQAPQTQMLEYSVRPIVNGVEQTDGAAFLLRANAPARAYLEVPLQTLPGHTPNDASVGDLDGDGAYELVLKQEMTPRDNSQSGATGETKLEAYKLDGTLLWRINLGRNIREGAHYTQFLVYDLDGDGKAEVACKTADGTVDGKGQMLGDASADYRNEAGYVLSGPEYLTIFDGLTGAALATVPYLPPRGNVGDWGDTYGNRVDRFLACVAYLDGVRPSLVMARGYYTRAVLAVWDWRNGQLTQRWVFDTRDGNPELRKYEGQGNHNLSVGDVDGDGRDEIMYGACAIDDDGKGLFVTGLGHGDALHMSDMDPDRPGLEVFQPHETPALYGPNGSDFRDARTGAVIFGIPGENADVGRGVAFDIDPRYRGYEMWAARGGLYSCKGELITTRRPGQMNFGVWWDADPLRELLDNITISKWDWTTSAATTLLSATGAASNNGTKATPTLSADVLGDWREEVILRAADNQSLRIYTTTIPATNRLFTLMHDRQYRLAIAWQNIGYNQPPHPGFYLGDGMSAPPVPRMYTEPLRTIPARGILGPSRITRPLEPLVE